MMLPQPGKAARILAKPSKVLASELDLVAEVGANREVAALGGGGRGHGAHGGVRRGDGGMTEMAEADLRETTAGRIVVKPGCDMKSPHELWSDPVEAEALKGRLDDLHRAKIRLADEVLVVGDCIGDSTRAEIAYARSLGKPVRFTHPEVDPDA
ncbi:hypothetical protein ACFU9F_33620 [Streptomyces zhihengii]|uniref:hypothetical protein n=1 Tax=Streptomyces zhihengii TaxID=1818004 RepID=UPI0036AF13F1